jgi:hypothetical protein
VPRSADDCFRVRTWHQRGRSNLKPQPPEFLVTNNDSDAFTCQPTLAERCDRLRFARGDAAVARHNEAGVIETEREANQDARIDLRRLEPGLAKGRGQGAPCVSNRCGRFKHGALASAAALFGSK